MRLVVLDGFCGPGGGAAGYRRAGFRVVGVDIKLQPRYDGDEVINADFIEDFWEILEAVQPTAIHASPPCQASSPLRFRWGRDGEYPELIPQARELLQAAGLPYVIENVPGAGLIDPVVLCGSMFGCGASGRQLRRHRLFETNFDLEAPGPCRHVGQPVGVYGHGGGKETDRGYKGTAAEYREAMEMPGHTKSEIALAIPPVYTEHVGAALRARLAEGGGFSGS